MVYKSREAVNLRSQDNVACFSGAIAKNTAIARPSTIRVYAGGLIAIIEGSHWLPAMAAGCHAALAPILNLQDRSSRSKFTG